MGDLRIVDIGSPAHLYEHDPSIQLELVTKHRIAPLFAPRAQDSNKGRFGHVLIVAGSRGKSGAAAMAGVAALRAGAGLVTVACPESALQAIAQHAPEIMTEPLPETPAGTLAAQAFRRITELAATRNVVAIGPGIGVTTETREIVLRLVGTLEKPLVIDADGLNCLAGESWRGDLAPRILTPHPGEMSRLTGVGIPEIQAARVPAARELAVARNAIVALKGERTLTATPEGGIWINPTGCPAMATAGTGDILTGMLSGLVAQFPTQPELATVAAVYLHGLCGELASAALSEQSVIATDLLQQIHRGIRAIASL
jgi:NAD(P)H-hydrate epimerase